MALQKQIPVEIFFQWECCYSEGPVFVNHTALERAECVEYDRIAHITAEKVDLSLHEGL